MDSKLISRGEAICTWMISELKMISGSCQANSRRAGARKVHEEQLLRNKGPLVNRDRRVPLPINLGLVGAIRGSACQLDFHITWTAFHALELRYIVGSIDIED